MQRSTKNNKYQFQVGDSCYIVPEDNPDKPMKAMILKRLKRPYRNSDNFYYCSWTIGSRTYKGIRYEKELKKMYTQVLI